MLYGNLTAYYRLKQSIVVSTVDGVALVLHLHHVKLATLRQIAVSLLRATSHIDTAQETLVVLLLSAIGVILCVHLF